MAEYKYRALGWQDDDIASLNVIDGTAEDNQVELQITKQGGGGTIEGPAIIGKDGITIDKAADSEKIEISGSGLVQAVTTPYIVYGTTNNGMPAQRNIAASPSRYAIVQYSEDGKLQTNAPTKDLDCTNKKYVDDNYVGKVTTANRVYITDKDGLADTAALAYSPIAYGVAAYDEGRRITTNEPVDNLDCTNKKYVDDNYVKKIENLSSFDKVYTVKKSTQEQSFTYVDNEASIILGSLPVYIGAEVGETEPSGSGRLVCYTPVQPWQVANKKYVDDAVAAGGATVDGTSIVKDTDGKIQLNQEYIDYLDNQLYQPPAISVFTMLDVAGAALPTSNELGTTLSAAAFNHQETNIKNIQGDNVELHINNAAAATTSTAKKDVATRVTLTTAQSITNSTKFTLKGTNTKGAAFSRDYQVSFYRYAYTAITDETTAPTSGATQQAAVSTFASNGSTFDYTKGGYIYFYTDNTGKKVQTNVLGQWADVDTTDMGKVTLTQNNGATHEYACYRIGPFIETGSAKYRV